MSRELSFLDIEAGLTNVVAKPWEKAAKSTIRVVANALAEGDNLKAEQALQEIGIEDQLKKSRGNVEQLAVSAMLLGSANVEKGASLVAKDPNFDVVLACATKVFQVICTDVMRQNVLLNASRAVTEWERDGRPGEEGELQVYKASKGDLVDRLNAAVNTGGQLYAELGANLTTSRLVNFGYLSQARSKGVETYKLMATLDGRTSRICRSLDGKTFRVERAYSHLLNTLQITDPNMLKTAAPWLKGNASTLADLETLDPVTLEDKYGVMVPPFHPYCRTILVRSGVSVEQIEALGSAPPPVVLLTPAPSAPKPKVSDEMDTAVFVSNGQKNLDKMEPVGDDEVLVDIALAPEGLSFPVIGSMIAGATVAEVRIADLIALDRSVSKPSIMMAILAYTPVMPVVVQQAGKLYVQSGLPVVIAAKLKGETTVAVRIVSL